MENCEQTSGLSVLEHGRAVNEYYTDIYNHIKFGSPLKHQWRMPDWMGKFKGHLEGKLLDKAVTDEYQIYHDCGKPYVVQVDENGKRHFPGHAEASRRVWLETGGNPVAAELMGMDMDVHLLKDEGVKKFCENPYAVTLLLTGFAEIHANCQMFGGPDSTSFKIKWKHLNRRGNSITNTLAGT